MIEQTNTKRFRDYILQVRTCPETRLYLESIQKLRSSRCGTTFTLSQTMEMILKEVFEQECQLAGLSESECKEMLSDMSDRKKV